MKKLLIILLLFSTAAVQAECRIYTSMTRYPADGRSSGKLVFSSDGKKLLSGPFGDIGALNIISREKTDEGEIVYFKSTFIPGTVTFSSGDSCNLSLTFYKIATDIDEDGFPDCAEFDSEEDRQSFRQWFVRIVESQFLKRNSSWNNAERDCAGLIRYAYREAMKHHDDEWLSRSGLCLDKNIPDITKFSYPDVPLLEEKIFKSKSGSAADLSTFDTFADAETLLKYNTRLVSRSLSDAHAGDLLFFRIESRGKIQFHSMIVTSFEKGIPQIVYHTGRGDTIKRVDPSYLKGSGPFVPAESNEKFLGIYRFLILE